MASMKKFKVVYQPETDLVEEWSTTVEAESFEAQNQMLSFYSEENDPVACFKEWVYVVTLTEETS